MKSEYIFQENDFVSPKECSEDRHKELEQRVERINLLTVGGGTENAGSLLGIFESYALMGGGQFKINFRRKILYSIPNLGINLGT